MTGTFSRKLKKSVAFRNTSGLLLRQGNGVPPRPPGSPGGHADPRTTPTEPGENDDVARILVACMPKSGSTFLVNTLASLPGMHRRALVPAHQRREQELCPLEIRKVEKTIQKMRAKADRRGAPEFRGYVAQKHVRYTEYLQGLIDTHGLRPVVLQRNIFDIVPSLRDHLRNEKVEFPMAFAHESMRTWPDERIDAFLVDLAIPWFFNFFTTWSQRPDVLRVRYEELMTDKPGTMAAICDYLGLDVSDDEISAALGTARDRGSRFNKGVSGRGQSLSEDLKNRIRAYADYYPDVDFSSIDI